MMKNAGIKKVNKVRKFFSGLMEKLDKKMEKKAKSKTCCCKPTDKEKNSCCN